MGKGSGICARCCSVHTGNNPSYCIECARVRSREWYYKNRDSEISRCSAYNRRNPHVPANSMARLRKKDPEHYKKYADEWKMKNKERLRVADNKKRLNRNYSKKNGTLTNSEWLKILSNQAGKCYYCGSTDRITMDHVIPLCRGGGHHASNIVAACKSCNSSKWKHTVEEWLRINDERNK